MADAIFTKDTVLKKDYVDHFIDILKGAGWEDISSNPEKDGFIMHSKGEEGNKDLFIQFRYGDHSGSTGLGNNPTNTTTSQVFSYRLINSYIPQDPVTVQPTEEELAKNPDAQPTTTLTSGIFQRPSDTFYRLYIAPNGLDLETELTIYYHVNKDRIIIITETPDALNSLPIAYYFGLPTHYTAEEGSRGVIALVSYYSSFSNSVNISDAVTGLPTLPTSTSHPIYCTLPPKSPNSAGIHTPVEAIFGDNSIGIRGKIDGITFLPNGSINNGDNLILNSKRFRAVQCSSTGNNSFPSYTMVIQIA